MYLEDVDLNTESVAEDSGIRIFWEILTDQDTNFTLQLPAKVY